VKVWHSRIDVACINKVVLHRVRLVLGWVTVFRRANHLGIKKPVVCCSYDSCSVYFLNADV